MQDLTTKLEHWATVCNDERIKYATAKADLMTILASKIREFMEEKKNIGVEMGLLLLLADRPALSSTYSTYLTSEQKYKGAERIMDALATKIIENQSQRKFFAKQDGGT